MTMSLTMSADDDDRVITYDQLPQAAQTFLKANFATKVPLLVTADWDDFTIRYESGEKIEFDRSGNSARTTLASPLLSWSATAASLR